MNYLNYESLETEGFCTKGSSTIDERKLWWSNIKYLPVEFSMPNRVPFPKKWIKLNISAPDVGLRPQERSSIPLSRRQSLREGRTTSFCKPLSAPKVPDLVFHCVEEYSHKTYDKIALKTLWYDKNGNLIYDIINCPPTVDKLGNCSDLASY